MDGRDGSDVISESISSLGDVLRFTNLNAVDVTLRSDTLHLYVKINATGHEIRVNNQFNITNRGIESIEFADGSTWGAATIAAHAWIRGTTGADTINGSNDLKDTLFGDLGNDTLSGGNGNDIYLYRSGDGSDIISESVNSMEDILRFTNLNAALTDNGIQFTTPGAGGSAVPLIKEAIANGECFRAHAFEYACARNDIEHRTTKAKHPWTNGQVERMNRTVKDATVKRFYYESHDQLRRHLADFVAAYNFGRRLKTPKGLTPYEGICKAWASQPHRFTLNPLQQMPGLTARSRSESVARRWTCA